MRPVTRTSFYGWQILAVGGAGGLLAGAALALPSKPFSSFASVAGFMLGAPTYGIGGPIVHWVHGHFEKGLVSLGGNIAIPILLGALGSHLNCGSEHTQGCGGDGWARGAAAGMLLAPVLDGLVLGWEEVPVDYIGRNDRHHVRHDPLRARFDISPYVLVHAAGRADLGVQGRF